MKRLMSVAVVLVLLGAALSLLAGCGGDTAKAKEYMQAGDKIQNELEAEFTEMGTSMQKAFTNVADTAAMKTAVEGVTAATASLDAKADKAIAEYEKIEGLSGVEDYKKYATLELEAGKTFKEILKATDEFLAEALAMTEAGNISEEKMTEMATSYQEDMTKLGEKMGKADGEAEALKKEKNL